MESGIPDKLDELDGIWKFIMVHAECFIVPSN